MAGRKAPTFTEVELEFLDVLWQLGESGSEEVQAELQKRGRELSDGSVRKVLQILQEKGHLKRRKEGRSFLYTPTTVRRQAQRTMLGDLLKRAFRGSPRDLVAALLESGEIDESQLDEIRRMIDAHESGEAEEG